MTGRSFGLSGWGRLILSLTLAVFLLGPSLCAYDCAADDVSPPVIAATTPAASTPAPTTSEHGAGKAGLCPHGGHCHHSPFADLSGPAADARVTARADVDLEAWTSRVPDSLNPNGPERPPRA